MRSVTAQSKTLSSPSSCILTLPLRYSLNYSHSGQLLCSLQWQQICSDGVMKGCFCKDFKTLVSCAWFLSSFIGPGFCWTPNCSPDLSARISAENLEATQSKSTCDTQAESCYFPAHRSSKRPNTHTDVHIAVNATTAHPEPASLEQADDVHGGTDAHPRCVGFQLLMATLSDALRWPFWAHSPSTTTELLGMLQSTSLCKTQSLEIWDSLLLVLPGDLGIPPFCIHIHAASPHVSSLAHPSPQISSYHPDPGMLTGSASPQHPLLAPSVLHPCENLESYGSNLHFCTRSGES